MLKDVLEAWKQKPLRDLLIELYIQDDMTVAAISKELKVSTGKISNWLNEYDIYKVKKDIFKKRKED